MKTNQTSFIFAFIAILLCLNKANAQYICQTPEISINSTGEEAFNLYVIEFKRNNRQSNTDLKIIPTIIHVIYRSAADRMQITIDRINGQIEATNKELRRLNADTANTRPIFLPVAADCNLQVSLATKKPDGHKFDGVIYHHYPHFTSSDFNTVMANTIVNPEKYLNVWVIPDQEGGAAIFPWERTDSRDGFWVGAKCFGTTGSNLSSFMNGGTTFTHELAHYLGVYHTFHNSFPYLGQCQLAHDSTIGDRCADTPLDWTLPLSTEQCDQGIRYCNELPGSLIAQTENYMYYNQDSCTNMFSKDQRARMRACLNSLRSKLVSLKETGCKGMNDNNLLFKESEKITVFPNPTQNTIHFNYHDLTIQNMIIQVYNTTGFMLKEVHSATPIPQLNLESFPKGIYYIKITLNKSYITKSIIKL